MMFVLSPTPLIPARPRPAVVIIAPAVPVMPVIFVVPATSLGTAPPPSTSSVVVTHSVTIS